MDNTFNYLNDGITPHYVFKDKAKEFQANVWATFYFIFNNMNWDGVDTTFNQYGLDKASAEEIYRDNLNWIRILTDKNGEHYISDKKLTRLMPAAKVYIADFRNLGIQFS